MTNVTDFQNRNVTRITFTSDFDVIVVDIKFYSYPMRNQKGKSACYELKSQKKMSHIYNMTFGAT